MVKMHTPNVIHMAFEDMYLVEGLTMEYSNSFIKNAANKIFVVATHTAYAIIAKEIPEKKFLGFLRARMEIFEVQGKG